MYTFRELQLVAPNADTWSGLRVFVGTAELGYKVAWSDPMVSLYGGHPAGWFDFRARTPSRTAPRWRVLALMTVPIFLDGVTHMIADVPGVGQGVSLRQRLAGHSDRQYVPSELLHRQRPGII